MYRWVTSANFFQKREKGIIDNPQTIEEKLKVAEAKLKVKEEKLAVIDLFIKARYEAGEWEFKGHKIKVERGDVVTAQSALAQQWGWRTKNDWDAKRVSRFLKDLEDEGWIKIKSVLKSHTIISLLIYVPATQAAKEPGAESAKNLPKNQDGANPGNAGTSAENGGNSAKDSGADSAKKVPISNKDNKENKIDNDDSSSKCEKEKNLDLKDRVINLFKEKYRIKTGATLFINNDKDYETIDSLIQVADSDFNKIKKIVNVFFEDKWVVEKSAYSLGSLCSSNNLNRFVLKVKQAQAEEVHKGRVIASRLCQGKSSMGFTFNFKE